MSVKTTLNIDKKILDRINEASDFSGRSRSDIIIMLLMKVMTVETVKPVPPGAVKYQESEDDRIWHRFHISYRDDEYEYFTDLRKILKMSLSRIVAFAVKKFLNEILYGKKDDNCYYQDYNVVRESIHGAVQWKIYWGKPQIPDKS